MLEWVWLGWFWMRRVWYLGPVKTIQNWAKLEWTRLGFGFSEVLELSSIDPTGRMC